MIWGDEVEIRSRVTTFEELLALLMEARSELNLKC